MKKKQIQDVEHQLLDGVDMAWACCGIMLQKIWIQGTILYEILSGVCHGWKQVQRNWLVKMTICNPWHLASINLHSHF
jgi:hypothetical protein